MIQIAKAMTDDEMKSSAQYFASIKWTPWIKVVETNTVPKTRIAGGLFLKLEGNETEPIGQRIIEVPENTEETEVLRNPRSGFIAYAPVGSVKKGEALVAAGGNGKTTQCAVCHGPDLLGLGPVPGIAGRSPSYIARAASRCSPIRSITLRPTARRPDRGRAFFMYSFGGSSGAVL